MTDKQLIEKALEARKNSYSPYSHFQVGAALLTKDGRVFTGCNVENAAFSGTICAERNAIHHAVAEGCRSFEKIVVVGSPEGEVTDFAAPCGVCRQVMREFCGPDFVIILAISPENYRVYTLEEMLPMGFGPENLQ